MHPATVALGNVSTVDDVRARVDAMVSTLREHARDTEPQRGSAAPTVRLVPVRSPAWRYATFLFEARCAAAVRHMVPVQRCPRDTRAPATHAVQRSSSVLGTYRRFRVGPGPNSVVLRPARMRGRDDLRTRCTR